MAEKKGRRDDEIQNLVTRSLEDATRFFEETLEPDMVEATRYYKGEPFGDEEEGRSQVVSMDVHDVTQGQMPSLMKIFLGNEPAVEFRPRGPDDVEPARLKTDYIDYVVREDNDGFMEYQACMKDGLVRRIGIVKWWYETVGRVEVSTHEGLTFDEAALLITDPEVTDAEVLAVVEDPEAGELFNLRVTRGEEAGRERFEAVPSDEFVFTEDARTLRTAPLVAHIREVARDYLLGLGIDEDEIDEAVSQEADHAVGDDLAQERQWHEGDLPERPGDNLDESQRPVLFAEAFMLVDGDDDKRGELRKFWCVGPRYKIVNGDGRGEIVDELPFALWTPDPEPHTIVGRSNYDDLKDVQRIKSQILRGTLNSLAAAIEPKVAIADGRVNVADLVNPEINGIVRVDGDPNQLLRDFSHQFLGMHTLPMLQHFDEVRESRSGWNRSSAGLDPEALQSSTREGVTSHLSASQQRLEMIAMNFAEQLVKPLYKGLLRLAIRHRTRARQVELNGRWVEVDPRHWRADQDVRVNIGIGQGTAEQRAMVLAAALEKQMELMQAGSPLVSWVEIRHTLGQILAIAGRKDADLIFKPWGRQEEQAHQQQLAQQPPPPDPTEMLVQIEQAKLQIEQQKAQTQQMLDQAKFQLEQWKAQREDDRKRDELARDAVLKEREIEAKHQVDIDDNERRQQVASERNQLDADVKREAARRPQGG